MSAGTNEARSRGLEGFVGRFGQAGSPGLLIELSPEGLQLRLPGAPADAGTPLHAGQDEETFELGAKGSGARLRFHRDGAGEVEALSLGGGLKLARHPDADPPDYVVGPPLPSDAATLERFEALFAREVAPGDGRVIDYDLSEPRSQFLAFLCQRKRLLAHGSNVPHIEHFEPRSQSLAMLREQIDSGVSACADALWAMAYAVIDRSRMRGSFQNSVVTFSGPSGSGRLYHFSIAQDTLAQSPPPFTAGTVYLFAREGFARLAALGSQLEWRASGSVRPLCSLPVRPDDMPLLHRIRGHDDSATRRHIALRDALIEECGSATAYPDGYTLSFARRKGLTRDLFELCESLRRAFAWIDLTLHVPPAPAPVELTLRGSPGLRDVLDAKLRKKLQG